jgi:hypothetical protein
MHGHGSVVTPRWRQLQATTLFIACVSEDEMLEWIRAIALALPPGTNTVCDPKESMAADMHGSASTEPVHSATGQGLGPVPRLQSCGARVSTIVECPFCAKDIEVRAQSEFVAHADRCAPRDRGCSANPIVRSGDATCATLQTTTLHAASHVQINLK